MLKTAAQESDSSEENDLCTPFLVPFNRTHNSDLFDEDDAFDNGLYEEQKGLIDAYNREDNAEDDSQLNDINNDEITVKQTLLEQSNSWPIERGDLQWTKTKREKDCLIIGNFSYIFMSKCERKSRLSF